MIKRGIATFTLDSGTCPRWLFERMVRLGRQILWVILEEYGPDEFIKRIADPVWFQSLGTVLAFDWNASGLTTILTAALKEAIRGYERDLGIFVCGGKGKTSRKTPDEIRNWGGRLSLPAPAVNNLVYNSRMSAKVDSSLIQDGFQIYHHSFFFSKNGSWAVVQQGMNTLNQTARRYHWFSENIKDLVCEPHSGIVSAKTVPTLDLTAKTSEANRRISTELIQGGYQSLFKDIQILRKHSSKLSKMVSLEADNKQFTFLKLEDRDFNWHPVLSENFLENRYLKKIFYKLCDQKPTSYEKVLAQEGVGPGTMRTLSLVSEVIYGARPSYEDPARYSFAHGGKDAIPYPVDRQAYDSTIRFFTKIIQKIKLGPYEKKAIMQRLETREGY